jgi:hypothetical protein
MPKYILRYSQPYITPRYEITGGWPMPRVRKYVGSTLTRRPARMEFSAESDEEALKHIEDLFQSLHWQEPSGEPRDCVPSTVRYEGHLERPYRTELLRYTENGLEVVWYQEHGRRQRRQSIA